MLKYLKNLIKSNTGDSMKSFALLVSVLSGSLISICVSFSLIWDVVTNGYLKTDLDQLGWFILCVGGFMAGGGLNKAISDYRHDKTNNNAIQSK